MKIKIFGKAGCAKCTTTKSKLTHFIDKWNYGDNVSLDFFDMDTVDGMAEGAYYDALKIPTTIVENDGTILGRWEGDVPNSDDVKECIEQALQNV